MASQLYAMSADPGNLTSEMSEMKKSLNYLNEQVKIQGKQIAQCLKNEKDTAALLLKLQRDHSELVNYTGFLEEYCLDLDTKSRKKHLILTGIPEYQSENKTGRGPETDEEGNEMEVEESNYNPTSGVALGVLQSIHETLSYEDIDVAYRVGKKGLGPRPILIKFAREQTRNEVNRKRTNLKDSDETKSSFLNEDLPAKINQQRAELRCIVNNARSKNVNAKSMGDRISIDNKIYTHSEIDLLPQGLKISDAKIIDTAKGLAFQSQYAFLSNLYPSPVKYNGIQFPSSEHAYQYNKAIFLGKQDAAYKIRIAKTSQIAKREGGRLPSNKDWDSSKLKTMTEIVFSKFAQSTTLQTKLLETGDRPLLEATYDSFWGCGFPLSARKLKQGEWHGRNHLGQILVDCRNAIKRERAASTHSMPIPSTDQSKHTQIQQSAPPLIQKTANNRQTTKVKTTTQKSTSPTVTYCPNQPSIQTQFTQQPTQQLSLPIQNFSQADRFQPPLFQNQNNQQPLAWPNPMMFPPPGFSYPNQMPSYYMYPPYPPASMQPNTHIVSSQGDNRPMSPNPINRPPVPVYNSPASSSSDFFVHGERRFSYDANLSPEIHV